MERCDYCEYRNSWDCEDGKVSNCVMCENFKLDFDTLSNAQKREVQRRLMDVQEDSEW